MVYLKTLFFSIVAPGTIGLLIPYFLSRSVTALAFESGPFRTLGLILMILGAYAYSSCAFRFAHEGQGTPFPLDPPKKLVVTGLYRFTRNPMYVGAGLVVFGGVFFFGNAVLLPYLALVFTIWHLFVLYAEEPYLRSHFGQEYEDYCSRVPRWIPRFSSTRQQP